MSLEFGTAPLAQVVVETAEGKLGAEDVRTIVEGLDPVALVACDAFAAETCRLPHTGDPDADNSPDGPHRRHLPRLRRHDEHPPPTNNAPGRSKEAAVERPSE